MMFSKTLLPVLLPFADRSGQQTESLQLKGSIAFAALLPLLPTPNILKEIPYWAAKASQQNGCSPYVPRLPSADRTPKMRSAKGSKTAAKGSKS